MKIEVDVDSIWMFIYITIDDGNRTCYSFGRKTHVSSYYTLLEVLLSPRRYKKQICEGTDFRGKISKKRYNNFLVELENQCKTFNTTIEELTK